MPACRQVYYYNTVTGDSAWEPPEGFVSGAPGADADCPSVPVNTTAIKGTPWSEVLCSDGKTYYYNAATQVSWFNCDSIQQVLSTEFGGNFQQNMSMFGFQGLQGHWPASNLLRVVHMRLGACLAGQNT